MSETAHTYTDFALSMTRGDELLLNLTVTKTPAGGVASPQDLTGGVVRVTGKLALRDPNSAAVFRLDSDALGGVSITDAAGGSAQATIPPAATEELPDVKTILYVDCVWIDPDGKQHTCQKGTLTVYPDVDSA